MSIKTYRFYLLFYPVQNMDVSLPIHKGVSPGGLTAARYPLGRFFTRIQTCFPLCTQLYAQSHPIEADRRRRWHGFPAAGPGGLPGM